MKLFKQQRAQARCPQPRGVKGVICYPVTTVISKIASAIYVFLTTTTAGAAVERATQTGVSIFSINSKYSVFLYLGHTVRPSGCVKLNSKSKSLQNNKCFNYCSVPNVEQFILMRPSGHLRFFKGKKCFSNHSVIDFDF